MKTRVCLWVSYLYVYVISWNIVRANRILWVYSGFWSTMGFWGSCWMHKLIFAVALEPGVVWLQLHLTESNTFKLVEKKILRSLEIHYNCSLPNVAVNQNNSTVKVFVLSQYAMFVSWKKNTWNTFPTSHWIGIFQDGTSLRLTFGSFSSNVKWPFSTINAIPVKYHLAY